MLIKSKQNEKGLENKVNVHSVDNTHNINLKNTETSRMIVLRTKSQSIVMSLTLLYCLLFSYCSENRMF